MRCSSVTVAVPRYVEAGARDQTPQAGWHDGGAVRAAPGGDPGLLGPGTRLPLRGPPAGHHGERGPRGVQLWTQGGGRAGDAPVLAPAVLRHDQLCLLPRDESLGGGAPKPGGGVDGAR